MKRIFSLLLCFILLFGLLTACAPAEAEPEPSFAEGYGIRAAVVYSGGENWRDMLGYLEQSPMLGLEAEAVQAQDADYSNYDILYLDESLLLSAPESFTGDIEDYTRAGGAVFLPNGFVHTFPADFLGISRAEKLSGCLTNPEYPEYGGDEAALQQLLRDFSGLYSSYADFSELRERDYGWGFVTDTAAPLVKWDGLSVYALNRCGEGYVFLTNPLLPNSFSASRLSMDRREGEAAFADTSASFNRLLLCGAAEYVAKQRYGYALERVNGYFGTPSMAWELHYEEITAIENSSMQVFSRLCEEYNQIPSFTLIRNSYRWFRRAESLSYLLGSPDGSYEMDLYENAYSSGTHIDSEGSWLSFASIDNAGSYFLDYPEYTLRAYPCAADYNGDALTDIFCGSSDGCIYYCEALGFDDGRLRVAAPQKLVDDKGEVICCAGFSAPALADIDGDSHTDLICGWNDGSVRWFSGDGSLSFRPMGLLLQSDIHGQALPALADIDGDGTSDMVLGSDKGVMMIYYGASDENGRLSFSHFRSDSLSRLCADAELGSWLAPTISDRNSDGRPDIVVGVFDGYLALLLARGDGDYESGGFISCKEMNYKGNNNLKFGNFSAACFADISGDGVDDLICGSQEYGMAYPIDSGYFPHESELREQIAFAREHGYYVGVHFYTNAYASAEREAYELSAHKSAFEYYGLEPDGMGANQHTWYTSTLGGAQSMSAIYDAGLLWQSGFAAPGSATNTPQTAAENVVSLPFYLIRDGERTLLMQNNATLTYTSPEWYAISARYRMPVCIYYHCDFAYESDEPSHAALSEVQAFREEYGYNFNREDQLMLASAASLHQSVSVSGGITSPGGITISPDEPFADYALYDEAVSRSLGLRLLPSAAISDDELNVDADIWYRDGNCLVLGLNRSVVVERAPAESGSHIRRVNMAADIVPTADGALVSFLSGGMMELAVEGRATTDSSGWTVLERENETVFIKYGNCESLNLIFMEDNNA